MGKYPKNGRWPGGGASGRDERPASRDAREEATHPHEGRGAGTDDRAGEKGERRWMSREEARGKRGDAREKSEEDVRK